MKDLRDRSRGRNVTAQIDRRSTSLFPSEIQPIREKSEMIPVSYNKVRDIFLFRYMRRDCARLRDHRMSWLVSKSQAAVPIII